MVAAPEPAFRHVVHRLRGPEEYAVAVSGASLVADFIAPQELPARIEQFQAPGWALDFHETHVKARIHADLPPGWASMGLMWNSAPSSWYGIEAAPGMLMCNPPGIPIDGSIAPGFRCLTVGVPAEIWDRCRAVAGRGRSGFTRFAGFQLPAPLFARIQRELLATVRLLHGAGKNTCLAGFAMREGAHFAASIASIAWEFSSPAAHLRDSSRNRARLARRAGEWMREHMAEAIQVSDVCLALRVSRRELEYAFRAAFDQSPRDFLQTLRLNAIRRALRARGDSEGVTRVALDHGVAHLGRFSACYRALFGENPSETLKRPVSPGNRSCRS